MFYQQRLDSWSDGVRQRLNLPLRLELWNGHRIDFSSDAPRVTIRVPSKGAIRCLLSPSLYQLGRAYVEGVIDVRGRAADMIAIVNALARGSSGPRLPQRLLAGIGRHTRQRDARAIEYHYDVSNEFYAQWLDPAMVYSCVPVPAGAAAGAAFFALDFFSRILRSCAKTVMLRMTVSEMLKL